ncbi:MAG TPA: SDR family oxidoreductase [Minicystis sp.]|nr:SDR family oxidoreductase [Minicystis sp.]
MLDLSGKRGLVTGASAGIGREIARLLAKDLGALVLVARRADRLEELARELRASRPGLRVEVRAVDLVDRPATGTLLDALEREGLAPDVLVNNAGFGDYGLFEERPWDKTEQMLELNVVSATFLLRRVVPGMIARGFGAIMNLGSSAGMLPGVGMSTYAASKAYLNHLSEALRAELAGTGVSVTVVCPGPVPTEFQEVAGTRDRAPMPEAFHVDAVTCAEEAVDALRRGRARVIPGAPMRAAVVSLESVPRVLVRPFLKKQAARVRGR